MENAYSECRRMRKKQWFTHLVAPQPPPNAWAVTCASTDAAALHCCVLLATVMETKWVHTATHL